MEVNTGQKVIFKSYQTLIDSEFDSHITDHHDNTIIVDSIIISNIMEGDLTLNVHIRNNENETRFTIVNERTITKGDVQELIPESIIYIESGKRLMTNLSTSGSKFTCTVSYRVLLST